MIKATQLRIGNIILPKEGTEEYVTVTDIDEDGRIGTTAFFYDGVGTTGTVSEAARGIPLTPEWLEKCGFGKSQSDDDEQRDIWGIQVANNTSLYYDPEEENKHWYLSYEWNNNHFQNDFWACPEFVHQLQNLFFALAGEEITINERA